MTTPDTLTTRDVAEAIDVPPARLRVYLRSCGDQWTPPGSGGRYSFAKGDVAKIRAGFKKWASDEATAKSKTTVAVVPDDAE